MVPLIERSDYFGELRKNAKFDLFFQLLNHSQSTNNFAIESEIDEIFACVLDALKTNDLASFNKQFQKISERVPKKTTPFVNDDLLIFVLIVGTKKFNSRNEWISQVLKAREGEADEGSVITKTFYNVLDNNYSSRENAFEVIIVLEDLLKTELISWDDKVVFFKNISAKSFPFYSSDFLNTMAIRGYDLMISQSHRFEGSEFYLLNTFRETFIKRARFIARTVQITITISLSFGLYKLAIQIPVVNTFFQNFEPILGILGLSVIGNMIPRINNFFYCQILHFFNYPDKLK